MLGSRTTWLVINIVYISLPTVILSCNEEYYFRCTNGYCINRAGLCDGRRDCDDSSDESSCICNYGSSCYREPLPPCSDDEFRCKSGACIPSSWECDGEYDCADLSDEHNTCVKKSCDMDQFTCDNGVCIDARLKCNSKNDCGDNSDETICKIHPANGVSSLFTQSDCGNSFRCKDGTCIGYNLVCNSIPECPDGSDEGGKCTAKCDERICDGSVKNTPTGCKCTCPKGYRLAGDGLTCIDVLECTRDPPVCSQLCVELEGSYSCKCFHEFTLRYDNVTCKSNSSEMSVYYAVRNELRQFLPARRNLEIVHVETTGMLGDIDLDVDAGVVYYGVRDNNSLFQLVVANSSRKSIANVGSVTRLAVDWITKNVYFISEKSHEMNAVETVTAEPIKQLQSANGQSQLMVCNFNERHCAIIAELDAKVSALAVDPLNKKVFYATVQWSIDSNVTHRNHLFRTDLDGQFTRTLASFYKTITDMAIDYRHKYIYVVKGTTIDRLDFDGGRTLNIVETSMTIQGLNLFEDHLYFLSQEGQTMHKCRLFGDTRRCTSFRLSAEPTEMFVIAQRTRQTPSRNPCITYKCSHLCIPNDIGATCLCENGKIVDELSDCRD